MSGHNKWSSIKHRKGAQDAKRGRMFTKFIKEITMAAREGGGDPNINPRLRTAIATAKAGSMPNDNIERAIKKGTGELDGGQVEEVIYEGYGPGGVALLIETVSDNRNRTTADVRHILSKYNGNLGENGCVAWMFNRRGIITITGENVDEDSVMEAGLEIDGFEDLEADGGVVTVYTDPSALYAVRESLENNDFRIEEAKLGFVPQNTIRAEGKKAEQLIKLLEMLEENDDITNVYANYEIDDIELERIVGS